MSKKDYITFAAMLKRNQPSEHTAIEAEWLNWRAIVRQTADIFAVRAEFNRPRFYEACGYKESK